MNNPPPVEDLVHQLKNKVRPKCLPILSPCFPIPASDSPPALDGLFTQILHLFSWLSLSLLMPYFLVSAKIRTLTEFHVRISCSQQPPSNVEIIATLRYFHQTLIGFLKDVPSVHADAFEKFNPDLPRANLYPNLNYSGLFYGIVNLLDAFPMLQSGQAGQFLIIQKT
uniref:ELMO domain-containing protein n=1 Tax=Steinernema glaseri TaxID=37863 RepID=A0A1I7ZDJ6_9BILA